MAQSNNTKKRFSVGGKIYTPKLHEDALIKVINGRFVVYVKVDDGKPYQEFTPLVSRKTSQRAVLAANRYLS